VTTARTFALYWHNGRSLGHTAESAKVARRLLRHDAPASIAALTGAYRGLDLLPEEVDVVKLPSFTNYDRPDGWHLRPRLALTDRALHELRADLAQTFLRHYRPETFIINHLPRGAHDELVPALLDRRAGHTVLTWRGVLFEPLKTEREYFAAGPARWIADHFCQINIHTHPEVFRLEEHYAVPQELSERFHYTGYLVEPDLSDIAGVRRELGVRPGERTVVCSMGGGQGAGDIWRAISGELRYQRARFDRALLVTGPYLEPGDLRALREEWQHDPAVCVAEYEPALPRWMRACDLFIGAAGSNMLGEVLSTGCNAVVVPRQIREKEQLIHAGRLEELGLLRHAPLQRALDGGLRPVVAAALAEPLAPAAARYFAPGAPYQRHLPGPDGTGCAC
jgi:predicted glycosyltransferase